MRILWENLPLGECVMILKKSTKEYLRGFCTTKPLIIYYSGLFFLEEFNCIIFAANAELPF